MYVVGKISTDIRMTVHKRIVVLFLSCLVAFGIPSVAICSFTFCDLFLWGVLGGGGGGGKHTQSNIYEKSMNHCCCTAAAYGYILSCILRSLAQTITTQYMTYNNNSL